MSPIAPRILIVDDDHGFRRTTSALLSNEGFTVETAGDAAEAIAMLRASVFNLLLLDLRMPGIDGLGLIEALRIWGNGIPILMISGFGTIDAAVRAMHLGADDFLTKPVEPDLLIARVSELLERRPNQDMYAENPAGIVGRSAEIRSFLASLRKVAPTDTTVLITGDTGTGKERAARAVHELSARSKGAFIAINCAAISEGVLESELFGHVRGAFTGALKDRAGLFEAAESGTVFLDEIGEMNLHLQQRLLRVLQEREVTRVGASKPIKVNVRVVAATNRRLEQLVAEGRFREDLFYRLKVFALHLPPLAERRSDIPLLVARALEDVRQRTNAKTPPTCSSFAMRLLLEYEWPGNVRQLFAVLEAAAIHADFRRIEAQHLPEELRELSGARAHVMGTAGDFRYRAQNDVVDERATIEAALAETNGALARTAELLGMGRTTLWRKLRAHGLALGATPGEGVEAVRE